MTKISKNKHPEFYGYEHPWDIPGNTKTSIKVYFIEFEDADGDKRYCPCSKEQYEADRNYKSAEMKREDRKTRCIIKNEKSNTEHVCRCKCSECPYGKLNRDIQIVSAEYLFDEFEYEIADPDYVSAEEELIKKERINKMNELISLLKESDRLILKLFSEGLNDVDIAKKINKPRTTVTSRRNKLFDDLREQLKDF